MVTMGSVFLVRSWTQFWLEHDARGLKGGLRQKRIEQRRLSRPCAACDHNVLAVGDGLAEHLRLAFACDASGDVIVELENAGRALADREQRRLGQRRQQCLNARRAIRKNGGQRRPLGVYDLTRFVGQEPDRGFAVGG